MRLRRLLVVVAATATVAVISLGPVPASVGALVDPATPSVSNIPAGPVYGTSFVSTVSTNSDGSPFVTSGTPSICTVGGDGMTVSLVGVGSCTLIAHTPATATFNAADGNAQTFGVAPAVPSAPTITNVPGNATVGNGFLATVSTDGDGPTSVQSNSTGICTVGGDGLTVSFIATGTCSLTAELGAGTNYAGAAGTAQTFSVLLAPTVPVITDVPASPVFGQNFVASVQTDGDGTTFVTTATPSVCTVGGNGLTVTFVGVGTCTLTAHVAAGATYGAADGSPQSVGVGQATPSAPLVANIPASPVFGGGFTAVVDTNGDGTPSVSSTTPGVCAVAVDGLTVSFVAAGSCGLIAQVSAGTDFQAADGSAQSFAVSRGVPTAPAVTNLPASPVFGGGFTALVGTNGDGAKSVSSSTPGVCTVAGDGLSVSYVGVGTCTLTAHVAAGADYQASDGTAQSTGVGQATPSTPVISNIPPSPTFGSGFFAIVHTNGDGAPSIGSSTPGVCRVAAGGLAVSFVGVGTCSLTAGVSAGVDYRAATGNVQSFAVGRATPTIPAVTNLPASSPAVGAGFTAVVGTNGDGTPSVTSSTPGVCTVGGDGLSVSFVGVGTCSLTAHVSAGADYAAADGLVQSLGVGQATPTSPSVTNVPGSASFGGGFTAVVGTNGDGFRSVSSGTPAVCTVAGDGLGVSFVGVGLCTLTAHVAAGIDYQAGNGGGQSFAVGQATPSSPSIADLPAGPTFGSGFAATVTTTGDGTAWVTSSTPGVCTVSAADHLTVSFVGVGPCMLTAHVGAGPHFLAGDGTAQGVDASRAAPTTPLITNLPGGAVAGGSFTASVSTNGDGPPSVASQTPAVCVVGNDGLTVSYVTAGSCTLQAGVGAGTDYGSGAGGPQTFGIAPQRRGYWLVGTDGGIFSFGAASFYGSMGGIPLQRPVVGITPTATRNGYWLVASDGGIFSFGDSSYYGSIPALGLHPAGSRLPNSLNAPIVGMVPSSTGHGYFMVASDGGVFAFGDARFEGSCPGIGGCLGTAVAVMPDGSGNGYWLVTTEGAVYAFGDAPAYGSPPLGGAAVVSAVATPGGRGYWVVEANGAVYAFGEAGAMGQPVGYVNAYNPATAIFSTSDGRGYWVAAARGDVFSYGDAPFLGSMAAAGLNGQIIAGFGF